MAAANVNVVFEDSNAVKCGIFSDTQEYTNTAMMISNFGGKNLIS